MEHVNQKWNIEIQLLQSDKATHILEHAETAALWGYKKFPWNCSLRSELVFLSGGSGHSVCSEAVWVTQTSGERTGQTQSQAGLLEMGGPDWAAPQDFPQTHPAVSYARPLLFIHPASWYWQIISPPLLYSAAAINSDITLAWLILCSSWFLESGSA